MSSLSAVSRTQSFSSMLAGLEIEWPTTRNADYSFLVDNDGARPAEGEVPVLRNIPNDHSRDDSGNVSLRNDNESVVRDGPVLTNHDATRTDSDPMLSTRHSAATDEDMVPSEERFATAGTDPTFISSTTTTLATSTYSLTSLPPELIFELGKHLEGPAFVRLALAWRFFYQHYAHSLHPDNPAR
jgi:hypothetical protein